MQKHVPISHQRQPDGNMSQSHNTNGDNDMTQPSPAITGKKRKESSDFDLGSIITMSNSVSGEDSIESESNASEYERDAKRIRFNGPVKIDNSIGFSIVHGIMNTSDVKQPGGKGNKRPLPRFVLEVDISNCPQREHLIHLALHENLVIEALLVGYKDNTEVVLDVLASTAVRSHLLKDKTAELSKFSTPFGSLVVMFSSHSNGRRLFVRFRLVDMERKICLRVVDSCPFETITKRGIEKQRKKEREGIISSRAEKPVSRIYGIAPSVGCLLGSQLVKITGEFKMTNAADVSVVFGETESLDIHCVKKDFIICDSPVIDKVGDVEVRISLDGKKTFIRNTQRPVVFRVVDTSREEGRLLVVQQLMKKERRQR